MQSNHTSEAGIQSVHSAAVLGAKPLFTVPESMAILCCGRTKLYELINAGKLEVIHLGKRCVRVKSASLEKLIAEGIQA